jgi:cell division protein FtsA
MDTRIGYPNEHLAGNSSEDISSPLFATAVGLVMNSVANNTQSAYKLEMKQNYAPQPPVQRQVEVEEVAPEVAASAPNVEVPVAPVKAKEESTEEKIKKSFFDKYVIKLKDFLDNAE